MKNSSLILSFSIAFLVSTTAFGGTKKMVTSFPAQYEGGNLPLKQNHNVRAVVAGNEIVFVQHGRRVSVLVQSISEITCSTSVHRRFGAAVLGLVPLMDLDTVETHYVGVTWTDNTQTGASPERGEVLFKLSAGEYPDFVAALERITGKQAVDTQKTPTSVHYDLTE